MGGRMQMSEAVVLVAIAHEQEARARREAKRAPRRAGFQVSNRVMRLEDRRLGTVRGVLGAGIYVVRWLDDDTKEQVEGSRLVSRFTTQTTGFVPKGAERAEINEETAA